MKQQLEKIRDLAKTAREHSLAKKYDGDVEIMLKQSEEIAEEELKIWSKTYKNS